MTFPEIPSVVEEISSIGSGLAKHSPQIRRSAINGQYNSHD